MFPSFAFKKPPSTWPIKTSYLLPKSYVIWKIVKWVGFLVVFFLFGLFLFVWFLGFFCLKQHKQLQAETERTSRYTLMIKEKKSNFFLWITWQYIDIDGVLFLLYPSFVILLFLHLLFRIYLLSSLLMYDVVFDTQEKIILE